MRSIFGRKAWALPTPFVSLTAATPPECHYPFQVKEVTELSTPDRVRMLIEPIVADLGVDLYDLELAGGSLRVTIDQPGGIGMAMIAEVTRTISRALDEHDPISGHFTLEVSSPGLERVLRTSAHFIGAAGTAITVKTIAGYPGGRRLTGTLRSADDDRFVIDVAAKSDRSDEAVEPTALLYTDIERARTVFEWGPTPKPGKAPKPGSKKSAHPKPGSKKIAVPDSKDPSAPSTPAAEPSASPNQKVPTS
jgi:ribosome maturation factor RimP